jgi:DNA-binding LytR/AlgR family response regulator
MKVTVDKDPKYLDPEIIVRCQELNDTLQDIISYIDISDRIIGEYEGEFCFIPTKDILYFESVDKAIFIYTREKVYKASARLYTLEEQLKNTYFQRISKSTILNLRKLRSVKSGKNYTLVGTLFNDEKILISRHYVQKIKEKLGV